jgi:hypothetical protein
MTGRRGWRGWRVLWSNKRLVHRKKVGEPFSPRADPDVRGRMRWTVSEARPALPNSALEASPLPVPCDAVPSRNSVSTLVGRVKLAVGNSDAAGNALWAANRTWSRR